jgi:hypothetical protein
MNMTLPLGVCPWRRIDWHQFARGDRELARAVGEIDSQVQIGGARTAATPVFARA